MAGLYLHIPFCRQACVYCNFHFSTRLHNKELMLEALHREIGLRKSYLQGQPLKSIYFGGGTPSVLTAEEINHLVAQIESHFEIEKPCEITLEANPDDLSTAYLKALRQSPVNRLSIGIQSFRESDLKFMNRSHEAHQAKECLHQAQNQGFTNITIDLIYGLPHQNDAQWKAQLVQLLKFNIPHFSAYALTVEPKTALAWQIKKGVQAPPDENRAARQFAILQEFAASAEYGHYELSNFARPGWRAVHNSSYWQGRPYLGIGPSAHSFNGKARHWNPANNQLYQKALAQNQLDLQGENLEEEDRYNEMIMTQLRLKEGLNLQDLKSLGQKWQHYALREAEPAIRQGRLIHQDHKLYIPPQWRFHSDGIAAELFWVTTA